MNFQLGNPPAKQKPLPPQSTAERLHRMLRHPWLIGMGIVLLIAGVIATGFYVQSRPTHLKIAVGPRIGDDVRLVEALQRHFAREKTKIRLSLVRKETGAESADALDKGEVDLAVMRRRVADEARDDTPEAIDRVWEEEAVRFGPQAPGEDCAPTTRLPSGAQRFESKVLQ